MTAYLLDTNIWLRAVQREAAQHHLAVEALAALLAQGHAVSITAQNVIEFWSVASRPVEARRATLPAPTLASAARSPRALMSATRCHRAQCRRWR